MKFIAGMDEFVGDWVASQIDGVESGDSFSPYTAIGLMDKGELIAGCVYNNYRKGSYDIELSFAAIDQRWATRANIKSFLAYPYLQLGCRRVTAIVDERNTKAMKFLTKLGMKCEGRMKIAMDGTHDAIIYGMLFDKCKWFKKELESWEKNQAQRHPIP